MSTKVETKIGEDIQRIDNETGRYYLHVPTQTKLFSVTTFLQVLNKGPGLEYWFKQNGFKCDEILKASSESGSKIHQVCENYSNFTGKRTKKVFDNFCASLTKEEKEKAVGFYNFVKEYKPKFLYSEVMLYNLEDGYAGTIDFICEVKGEIWLVDIKTGKSLHKEMRLQLAAYDHAAVKMGLVPRIDKRFILHLKDTKIAFNLKEVPIKKIPQMERVDVELRMLDIIPERDLDYEKFKQCISLWTWMRGGFNDN